MKALILSDIHANADALAAIWAAEGGADAIYAAGDYVDYGPQPMESIDWLVAHGARTVYGNHDQTVMQTWQAGEYAAVPDGQVRWADDNCRRLNQAHLDYLLALPEHLCFELDGIAYLMQHRCGQGYDTIDSLEEFDAYWAKHAAPLSQPGMPRRMIFGHTHRQMVQMFGEETLWLNPGSVSYRRPDEVSKDAFYMVIEDGHIRFRHVAYDRSRLCRQTGEAKAHLHPAEWHVGNYFFCQRAEDGPMGWPEGMLPPGIKPVEGSKNPFAKKW